MRTTRLLLTAAGGFIMASLGTSAVASGVCNSSGTACNPGVSVTSSPYVTQPMGINYAQPYDYLQRFAYNQTPQMNVMRVETGAPMAELSQAPGNYWGGCAGGVTCGSAAPQPVYQAPAMPSPMYRAPVYQAPVVQAPRTYVGQGYNPANFAPRQYGDNTFVPGIAHIPTSIVDRSPITRDQALMSGRAVAQPVVSSYASSSSYGSTYSASNTSVGGGWEKVSGPTIVDGMLATEILCKQPDAQVQSQAYQVVRPIVAVPYAVPTAANCAAPTARTVAAPQMRRAAPVAAAGRYGNNTWSY